MLPLNYFSDFFYLFFSENSSFCDVYRRLDNFQSHLKENTVKVRLKKTLIFPYFPNPNFKPNFSLRFI